MTTINMTTIKICGITSIKDALICGALGVDFIGINFYPKSPRFVDISKAEAIVNKTKQKFSRIKIVGVFQNEQEKEIIHISKKTGIDLIQLHGDEGKSYQFKIKKKTGKDLIKAVRLKNKSSVKNIKEVPADFVLLDSFHPNKYGGTGITLDKRLAIKAMEALKRKKIILAGGINQSNAKEFLALCPYGIDINSGVEIDVGKKDGNKIRNIVSIIKGELK